LSDRTDRLQRRLPAVARCSPDSNAI